jgi:hypothetical protein
MGHCADFLDSGFRRNDGRGRLRRDVFVTPAQAGVHGRISFVTPAQAGLASE